MITDTAKSIFKRVSTIATECLHTVFESALKEKYQDEWFNELVKQGKISSATKSIYGVLLADLLKILSSECEASKVIINKADKTEGLIEAATKAFKTVKELKSNPPDDMESADYLNGTKEIAEVIDRFSAVRDSAGQTYISKILNRISLIKKEETIPTYSVKETISKYKFNITQAEFVACCVANDIPIAFDGKEAVFQTQHFNAVKDLILKHTTKESGDKRKQDNQKLLMKIIAGVLAVILIILSSAITNAISKASLTKKYGDLLKGNNEDMISSFFSTLNTSSDNVQSDDGFNSQPLFVDTSSVSLNQDGRIKNSYTIDYMYDGSQFVVHNTDTSKLGNVYAVLKDYEYYSFYDKYSFGVTIYNDTDKIIKNIGCNISILNEDNQTVFAYVVDKITKSGNSVSIKADETYYLHEYLTEDKVLVPNADLGFCTFKVDLYYEEVK